MRVLVTGGAGFIGSNTVRILLNSGHEVVVVDNLVHGYQDNLDPKALFVKADIADDEKVIPALIGVDAVIHMAGLIVVPESVKDPKKYCENNVLGTVKFLESMRKAGITRIIFSSSACVYGTPENLPIEESEPLKPDNPYGATKASIEAFLQSYHAVFNFDVTILRYFNPYGPGKMYPPITHAIPNFVMATLAKKPVPLYWKGEQIRDFIYIDDLARAHVDVLGLHGFNVFNLGMEKGVKVKDVVEQIFEIVGFKVPIDDLGKRLGDVQANYASSEKLHKAVGWKAEINLKEGLKRTIEYYRN